MHTRAMQVQVFLDRSPFCTACPASLPSPYARAGLFAHSITASRYHLPAPFDSLAAVYSARTGLTRAILNVVHSLVISFHCWTVQGPPPSDSQRDADAQLHNKLIVPLQDQGGSTTCSFRPTAVRVAPGTIT